MSEILGLLIPLYVSRADVLATVWNQWEENWLWKKKIFVRSLSAKEICKYFGV